MLTSERGLWPTQETRLWRLDETEGPNRIRYVKASSVETLFISRDLVFRKKLEAEVDKVASSRADIGGSSNRDLQVPEIETRQNMNEVPPWAESYEISSTEVDGTFSHSSDSSSSSQEVRACAVGGCCRRQTTSRST